MVQRHPPFVSVIIPHYNSIEYLRQCLDKLSQQTWPRAQFEIVVADNNSAPAIAAEVRSLPGIQIVHAPEPGAGPARNAGAAAARGDVLAFLDCDCYADRHWLGEGVAALDRYDYAGGDLIILARDSRRVTPAEGYDVIFGFDCERFIKRDKYASTGNLFVPRHVFDKVGPFRSGISEDMEWCWRANSLGFRLGHVPRAVVYHPPRFEWKELARKWDRVVAETIVLDRERYGAAWRWRWLVRTALTAISPLAHAPKVILSRRLEGLGSKGSALAGLFAIRLYRARRMIAELAAASRKTPATYQRRQ